MEIKVKNITSSNGNSIPNQFIIRTPEGTYFQSYDSIIAVKKTSGKICLDETYWDYSQTTGKYRNQFLGESKRDTEKNIKEGIYKLSNLN